MYFRWEKEKHDFFQILLLLINILERDLGSRVFWSAALFNNDIERVTPSPCKEWSINHLVVATWSDWW